MRKKGVEHQLLKRLIDSGKLGVGNAKFEVMIKIEDKPQYIDMVYESTDTIWIVEAKEVLNKKAIGQAITYLQLYATTTRPKKELRAAIVCFKANKDLLKICQSLNITVFVMDEHEEPSEKSHVICGVCGERMVKTDTGYKCVYCEYFFGSTPVESTSTCIYCGKKYGVFPSLDNIISEYTSAQNYRLWLYSCPDCRREKCMVGAGWATRTGYGTLKDVIAELIRSGQMTKRGLLRAHIELSEEFIDFCLDKFRPSINEVMEK